MSESVEALAEGIERVIRRYRTRLAEVEVERDHARRCAAEYYTRAAHYQAEAEKLRKRLEMDNTIDMES